MKNKKYLYIVLIIFIILVGVSFTKISKEDSKEVKVDLSSKEKEQTENQYVLEGFPSETIPLYELKKISAMKYFVNDDPNNYESYFDKNKNYYNVVFYSKASQKDVLSYYESLMDEVNPDSGEDRVEGTIGKYKVSASHYGESNSTTYLQVYMPSDEYAKENPYFEDFTSPFEIPESWIEYESSYGLLNQNGGEKEYTRYFNIDSDLLPDDIKENSIEKFYKKYSEILESKSALVADDNTGIITWKEDNSSITVVFKSEHGRIYYTERQPLSKSSM